MPKISGLAHGPKSPVNRDTTARNSRFRVSDAVARISAAPSPTSRPSVGV